MINIIQPIKDILPIQCIIRIRKSFIAKRVHTNEEFVSSQSHCRLKWPKSNFFAQMWPIPNFLMTVWKAQIRFFQIRPRPLSYVVLNRIHIPCFASDHHVALHVIYYVIKMRQTSQFCAGGHRHIYIYIDLYMSMLEEAGRLKSQWQTIYIQ